jgi:hypothetical protein
LDCPCGHIKAPGDDDSASTADTGLEDDPRIKADAAPGFIVASQIKTVDPQADKAVSAFLLAQGARI